MIHVFVGVSLLFSASQMVIAQYEYMLNGNECGFSDPTRRIVNGRQALVDQFPWVIRFGGVLTRCGGSIITKRHVLTAGHCTLLNDIEASEVMVFYGHSNFREGLRVRGIRLLRHPQFDPPKFHNDIAIVMEWIQIWCMAISCWVHSRPKTGNEAPAMSVYNDILSNSTWMAMLAINPNHYTSYHKGGVEGILKVEQDFHFGTKVRPICLPTHPVDIFNKDVIVAGWGYLEQDGRAANNLRYTLVKVLPNARCAKKFIRTGYRPDIMYCAYRFNTDACQGDSGGPLMTQQENGRYLQVGIVSYGIGCAVEDMPGVYARLDALMPWLQENLGHLERFRPLGPYLDDMGIEYE